MCKFLKIDSPFCYQSGLWYFSIPVLARPLEFEKITIESGEISQSTGSRQKISFSYDQNGKHILGC